LDKPFRVKELAQERGLTQEELSARSGVKISTLRRIWQNNRAGDPRGRTLLALADALQVSVKELYADEEAPQTSSSASLGNKMSLTTACGFQPAQS
jgi:transcriptional regulator with XRE-family HTH domain